MSAGLILGRGAALRLGAELARGGEGTIHVLPDRPGEVAKLYAAGLTRERAAKLRAMVALPPERVPRDAAWPADLVTDRWGTVQGVVMPRVAGRHDLHTLLAGASRRSLFPQADYGMLVATAANLARAVATVHEAGHVIGDVNERCAMVGADATVRLIDCDSYQIETDTSLHTCDVGIPMYQPPELQQVSTFRGLRRIRNHDVFGLAVLIFQLLFFGRHPYAGRPAQGDMPELPEAIRDCRFAWSGAQSLLPPPHTLRLEDVGSTVADYFHRAFGREGAEQGRPRAAAWAEALDGLRAGLKRCPANPAHAHLNGACPICALEHVTGVSFFATRTPVAADPAREAAALWAAIEAETPPPARAAPPLPAVFNLRPVPWPAAPARGWLGHLLSGPRIAERLRREAALMTARGHYEALAGAWRRHDAAAAFKRARTDLARTRDQVLALCRQPQSAAALARHEQELNRVLSAHTIAESGLKGLGKAGQAKLVAAGIVTAADISADRLEGVAGVGPKRKAALLAWRDDLVAGHQPVQASGEAAAIARLMQELRDGVASLRALCEAERRQVAADQKALREAARALAQAEADLNAPSE